MTVEKIFDRPDETIVVVEDSLSGFRRLNNARKEFNKKLIFGLRIDVKSDSEPSKVVFFAKNDDGFKALKKINNKAAIEGNGVYTLDIRDLKDIDVTIPFYDSYLHKNIHNFGMHHLDLNDIDVTYFEESNDHPFDFFIKKELRRLKVNTMLVKSVYYEHTEDFKAFQFFKAICNRNRPPTFDNPRLNHLCSDKFSYQSCKNTE